MSDLSRLLDDVYGTNGGGGQAPQQPEWASEAALDEVFANWVPGLPEDAAAPPADPIDSFADSDIFEPAPEPADDPLERMEAFAAAAPSAPTTVGEPLDHFEPADDPLDRMEAFAAMPAPAEPVDELLAYFPTAAPVAPAPEHEIFDLPMSQAEVEAVEHFDASYPDPVLTAVVAAPEPAPAPASSDPAPWQPSDDDILPVRKRGLSFSFSLRRR